jgi:hypothetical protein
LYAAGLVLLVATASFFAYRTTYPVSKEEAIQASQRIHASLEEEEQFMAAFEQQMINGLDQQVESCFADIKDEIQHLNDTLASFRGLATLMLKLTYDKMSNDTTTEAYINQLIDKKLSKDFTCVQEYLNQYLGQVEADLNNRQDELIGTWDAVMIQEIGKNQLIQQYEYENTLAAFQGGFKEQAILHKNQVWGNIGLLGSIKSLFSKNSLIIVKKFLGALAQRMKVSTTLAGYSIVADGPLPVGDAIGLMTELGGAAWTAYDLYYLQQEMATELQSQLTHTLAGYHQKIIQEGTETIHHLVELKKAENLKVKEILLNKIRTKTRPW